MEFKCNLRIIFAERNISQRQFAKEIGISETTLSLIARGRTLPRFDVAYRIAQALGIPIEEIWVVK